MKKIFVIFISIITIISLSVPAFADGPNINTTENINLSKQENEFTIEIDIDNSSKYAGAEFGVQCGEDVKIKSVDYNINGGKAGPVYTNGLTWFSFFSGENDFSGNVTATITLEYSGENNTSIVIDNISIYTKNNVTIDTYKVNDRKVIDVKKEGANNVITPLEPPVDNNIDNETNNNNNGNENNGDNGSSGDNNKNENNSGNNNSSNINNSSKTSTSSKSKNSNDTKTKKSDKDTITINKSKEDNKNLQEDSTNINDWEVYGISKVKLINIIILLTLIISITCNFVLGYSYVKAKKLIKKLSNLDNIN